MLLKEDKHRKLYKQIKNVKLFEMNTDQLSQINFIITLTLMYTDLKRYFI